MTQTGENGHIEHAWSSNTEEQICQLAFQLVRLPKHDDGTALQELHTKMSDVLTWLFCRLQHDPANRETYKFHLSVIYRLIGQTRDIVDGKGERTLTHMMIRVWYGFHEDLAKFALRCMVMPAKEGDHPFGSWKDIKYFCAFCRKWDGEDSPTYQKLLEYCAGLINWQLKQDETSVSPSLVAKWVPREKSAFGWMYEALATNYFNEFLVVAETPEQKRKATLKCKTLYRKLIASINKRLDTLQIKQCGGQWSEIDFGKVTSVSLNKQRKALLNIQKNGTQRSDAPDRVKCATLFQEHIQRSGNNVKGARVSMVDFVNSAMHANNTDEIQLINAQWENNASQTADLGNLVAMVDVSSSMNGDPMAAAIALGIRIAEKSAIGNRVLTFSTNPSWVNLDECHTFVDKVECLEDAEWDGSTNFYAALMLILDAIKEVNMSPDAVQNMTLVVLSDMQIDEGDASYKKALYDTIQEYYAEAGMTAHGVPYKAPHIVFWNLRSTHGFPALSSDTNTSMLSGFSPAFLNQFCEEGTKAFSTITPWTQLLRSLSNERYTCLLERINAVL